MPTTRSLWPTLFIIVVCLMCQPATATGWQDAVRQGDELYARRHEVNGGRENLEAAIERYKEALEGIPGDDRKSLSKLYVKLSRAYFKLAHYFAEGEEEVLEFCDKGEDWAKKAIKADPRNADAYYWKAANLGLFRSINRVSFRGGLMGGKIKEGFERAIALDERCEHGCAYMRLGEYLLARGNPEEAIGYARKAVEIGPKYLMNHIILAEILWESGNRSEAREVLEYIAAQEEGILPSEILENRYIIRKARGILEDLRGGKEPDW